MNSVIAKVIEAFLGKKKIIGWVSAVAMVAGAAAVGMSTKEFKDAVCSAPIVEEK